MPSKELINIVIERFSPEDLIGDTEKGINPETSMSMYFADIHTGVLSYRNLPDDHPDKEILFKVVDYLRTLVKGYEDKNRPEPLTKEESEVYEKYCRNDKLVPNLDLVNKYREVFRKKIGNTSD